MAPRSTVSRQQSLAVLGLVFATLLWGGTFVAIRDSVREIRPVTLVWTRFAAASVVFALVLLLQRRAPAPAEWRGGLLAGLLAGGGYLFQAIGLTQTSAGTSAFLTCAGSLLGGVFAWPLLGQRPGARVAFGILLALAGSALLSGPIGWRLGAGEAWTLLGSVCWALQIVVVAKFAARTDPLGLTAVHVFAIALLLAPFAGSWSDRVAPLRATSAVAVAYLIVAGSVVAPLLQIRAQKWVPPARVGILLGLEPVFALLFAVLLGGESYLPRWWLGAALILVAVASVELRPPSAASRATS